MASQLVFSSCGLSNPLPSFSILARTLLPILLIACHCISNARAENHGPTIKLSLMANKEGQDRSNMGSLSEWTMVGSLIGLVEVEDKDAGPAGEITCDINSNFVGLELITTNYYKLLLVKQLDRELTAVEFVTVTCIDNGTPPMSKVATFSIGILDENDNIPTFTERVFKFNLKENSPVGTFVGVTMATDMDQGKNAEIEYALEDEDGEISSLFDIGLITGNISSKVVFDRESISEIHLYTFATDHGEREMVGLANVTIHITDDNDNAPSITSTELSIMEDLPALSRVGVISAEDKDIGANAEIEFSLVKEDDNIGMTPPFIVKTDGGVIAAVSLDRELRDRYVLKVVATDGGNPPMSTTSTINIIVLDKNDNPPVIVSPAYDNDPDHFNSSEAVSVDWTSPNDEREVFQVVAFDIDIEENARLSYTIETINNRPVNEDSLFRIDKTTGQVFLQRGVRANDEPAQILSLVVHDGGEPSLSARAWLNVSLDVDFSSLHSQPTVSKTTQGSGREGGGGGGNNAGGGTNASSHLISPSIIFHLAYMFVLIFRYVVCNFCLL